MGANEEYLDKLLQSVSEENKPITDAETTYSEDMTDEELLASLVDMYSDELAEFKTEEIIHKEETSFDESIQQEQVVAEEAEPEIIMEENSFTESPVSSNSGVMSQSDIEALLGSLQQEETETAMVEEPAMAEEAVIAEEPAENSIDNLMADSSLNWDDFLGNTAEEPQVLDAMDADMIIPQKDSETEELKEDDLLKEMGIDSMSAEQIDELLNAAAAEEQPKDNNEMNMNDLFGGLNFADDFDPEHNMGSDMADLLGGMLGGNEDLAEIGELLQKADNNERVDDSNLRNLLDMDEDIGGNDLLNELLKSDTNEEAETANSDEEATAETKPKKEKKQKIKKEKQPKEPKQPKEKKEGDSLWKKITSIMFEEEDDLEDGKPVAIAGGDGEISLVDDDVLAGLMDNTPKKDKKKKEKAKADKNKKKNAATEEGEEVIDPKEQAKLEKKKQKAEKAAAKKKAKEEKAEADKAYLKAQPSISTKRAAIAFLFALSIMGVILVIYAFVPSAMEKANARKAYYNKEYYEAYELLAGKELNDSDTILLNKVTCILKIQRKLDAYNNYVRMDNELEALNALIEAVELYGENYNYAKALSIQDDIDTIYGEILIILNGKYGVSEDMAKEINACATDAEYTLRLQYIIEGKTWGTTEDSEKPMEDVLPEEEELLEGQ